MNERDIFYIGTRQFDGKDKGKKYYVIDYVRLDTMIPKTDFIDVLEFIEINKKMKDKNFCKCTAILKANSFDKLYVSGIK